MLEELPALVLERILCLLGDEDVLAFAQTCKRGRDAAHEEGVWRPRCEAYGVGVPGVWDTVLGPHLPSPAQQPVATAQPTTGTASAGLEGPEPHTAPTNLDSSGSTGTETSASRPEGSQPPRAPALGFSYRTLYLGLLRQFGYLLVGKHLTQEVGPAALRPSASDFGGPMLWQATATPFGGLMTARFTQPGAIICYSVIAYRLNGPVQGRPVLRILPRLPPEPLKPPVAEDPPCTSCFPGARPMEPSAPDGKYEGQGVLYIPNPHASLQDLEAETGGQPSTPPVWRRLMGMMQDMWTGAGGSASGTGAAGAAGGAGAAQEGGAGPSGEQPPPLPPTDPTAPWRPKWHPSVICCCQVYTDGQGSGEHEHPAMLRLLPVPPPRKLSPSAVPGSLALAVGTTEDDAAAGSSGGAGGAGIDSTGQGSGGGASDAGAAPAAHPAAYPTPPPPPARTSGGGAGTDIVGGAPGSGCESGFSFHCSQGCRHTDFDPLLRHTGTLGPGVNLHIINLPESSAPCGTPLATTGSTVSGSGANVQPGVPSAPAAGGNPANAVAGVGSGVNGGSASTAALPSVPEVDAFYSRRTALQFLQHHTRYLRRRSSDSHESKALVYKPLKVGSGHPLAGLWRGTYAFHGMEIINLSLEAHGPPPHPLAAMEAATLASPPSTPMLLHGVKVTGDSNVPRGQVSIEMDIGAPHPRPTSAPGHRFTLPPHCSADVDVAALESLTVEAVYRGRGHIAQTGFELDSWTTVEVVVFSHCCMGVIWHELESFSMFSRLPL